MSQNRNGLNTSVAPPMLDSSTHHSSLITHHSETTHHFKKPHAVLLYHYFHPDDVVSARLYSDLAEGLVTRGWDVTAVPCGRGCRDESVTYPPAEDWHGVRIRRAWRPAFRQSSNRGRLLNAGWMLASWAKAAITLPRRKREVMVVGTDPVLGVLAAVPWRTLRRRTGIVHWCHDLYPEAPIADGMVRETSPPVRVLKRLLAAAYRRCDLLADLGPCMGELLAKYGSAARPTTLTPWALVEPDRPVDADPATRAELFGDAKLGLLYSGNFGRAHGYAEFLDLARSLRSEPVRFCFAGRGNRADELRKAVTADDRNVTFAGFAPEADLEKRLGACDLHLVSLRPEWTGTVVPSKFFGALAAGRGVVFAGSPRSAIARWIEGYRIGWVLTPDTLPAVAADLRRLAANPAELLAMRERCHAVYREHFSKRRQLDRWDAEMRAILR
jgi:colanic acid biosynthesis glycosyl transferase WcaI